MCLKVCFFLALLGKVCLKVCFFLLFLTVLGKVCLKMFFFVFFNLFGNECFCLCFLLCFASCFSCVFLILLGNEYVYVYVNRYVCMHIPS